DLPDRGVAEGLGPRCVPAAEGGEEDFFFFEAQGGHAQLIGAGVGFVGLVGFGAEQIFEQVFEASIAGVFMEHPALKRGFGSAWATEENRQLKKEQAENPVGQKKGAHGNSPKILSSMAASLPEVQPIKKG